MRELGGNNNDREQWREKKEFFFSTIEGADGMI